jgi:N-acetylmuramoyl-L-alanine amidase
MKRLFSIVFIIVLTLSNLTFASFTEEGSPPPVEPAPEHPRESRFRLPENMRAVVIRPEITQTGNIVIHESDFDEIAELGMNTVIIETFVRNRDEVSPIYTSDLNRTDQPDLLLNAAEAARRRGLNVFAVFDVNSALAEHDPLNSLITVVHKFAVRYRVDGIILDGFYNSRCEESFTRYMAFGAGIGYENWLFDSSAKFFTAAADTIRLTDNTIPVGIMLRGVCGTPNFADTRAFVESGAADFMLVDAPDALTADITGLDLPFRPLLEVWGNHAARTSEIPMYVLHHNQRIGENSPGWRGDDQLLRQISAARATASYRGSAFNSLSALRANRLDSTTTLRAFFAAEINEETLFEDLVLNSPRSLNFATNDAMAFFQGTHDDNFPVYINDERILLNEAGNFYAEMPLTVGMNRFTLRHKGQNVHYSIERRIVTLNSLDESIATGTTLEVEGGTSLAISAVAYRGSVATAVIGGTTVTLTRQDVPLDDAALNVSYALFTGTYRVPDGVIGRAQNLGTVNVTASYRGYVNTIIGANIRVIALPEPPPPPSLNVTWFDRDSAGSGEVVGRINPVRSPSERVQFVRITENNTHVFAANTTGFERDPSFSPLPAGTRDYFRAQVGDFFTTASGRRVSQERATLENGVGMGENALNVLAGGTNGGRSFLRIGLDHRSTFNIRLGGVTFHTGWGGDFNIRDFDATHVYIDFDNVTSVTQLPSFEHNLVFSSGRWETVTINDILQFRLVLQLRQRGVYGGHFASYDASGNLMLTFPVLRNSLPGMNIVIDPGHGVTATGGFDPGAVAQIRETDANQAVARQLRDVLRARGANAVILPTHESHIAAIDRPGIARTRHNADLFISLHANSAAGNSGARGQEVWYFTPFSQPLAANISASMAAYFRDNVYGDRTLRNRGAKFAPFLVTIGQDFPAVLVEMGFVTNMEDAMALASPEHQAGIAAAIASGIQSYLGRSNITQS